MMKDNEGLGLVTAGRAAPRAQQNTDGSWLSGNTADQRSPLKGDDHLVHRRRRRLEVPLHVGLCRWAAVYLAVVVNECEILPLHIRVSRRHWSESVHSEFTWGKVLSPPGRDEQRRLDPPNLPLPRSYPGDREPCGWVRPCTAGRTAARSRTSLHDSAFGLDSSGRR